MELDQLEAACKAEGTQLDASLRLNDRLLRVALAGRRIGFTLQAVGLGILSATPSGAGYLIAFVGGLVASAGSGLSFSAFYAVGMSGLPTERHGLTAGLLNTAQQTGAAIFIALLVGGNRRDAHVRGSSPGPYQQSDPDRRRRQLISGRTKPSTRRSARGS